MKKTTFKRISSAILAVVMTLVMIPAIVLPAFADTLSGTYQNGITWKFYTSTGYLIFSGSGELGYGAVNNAVDRGDIVKVTIEDGITAIDDSAFINCINMKSITIPNSVNRIGKDAFYNCYSLKSITIPNGITSIASSTFENCKSLTSINIPYGVRSIGGSAFSHCEELLSITIPNTVKSIGSRALGDCYSLTSLIYCGTNDQWNSVTKENNWNYLVSASTKYHDYQDGVCTVCGDGGVHTCVWDEGAITTEPTHITEGVKTYTCECGEIKTEAVERLRDHEWDEGVITTEPTHTTEGVKTYTCICGETKTENIPCLVLPEKEPTVAVSDVTALVGKNFNVTVSVNNNPGIWSMAFELPIDTNVFEFVSADTSGSIFDQLAICQFDTTENTYKFNGYNSSLTSNVEDDGKLVTITLKVKEGVPKGEYKLALELLNKDIINVDQQKIEFTAIEGEVNVLDYILGDANGDGDISNADVLVIFRYIYNADLYPIPQHAAADVNGDGEISNADVLCIFRYIYNPALYPIV